MFTASVTNHIAGSHSGFVQIAGEQRVKILDIGGGLPMNYLSDEETPTFEDYASELQKQIPEMWIPGK